MLPTNNFYVYGHYKPNGTIFYIGKGYGNRAWQTRNRNNFWQNTVNKHGTYQVVLLHEHLSETEAFLKEKEEIMFWGRRSDGGFLINLTDGGEGTSGYVWTAELRAKRKAAAQKLAQDPVWKANHKAAAQKLAQDPVWKAAMQKLTQDPAWKAKNKAANQKLAQDPAWKAKQKAAMQKLAQNPVWKANNKAAMQKLTQDPAWKAKQKAAMQKLAQDENWLANVNAASVPRQTEFSVISPDGTLYLTQRNLNKFCRTHGLHESCMRSVLKGKRNHHKGWKKYIPPINNYLLNQFI